MSRIQNKGHFLHQVTGRTEYLTPKKFIDELGPFDLDPCASKIRPWPTAKRHLTEGGLETSWAGFVFVNPPYGRSSAEHKWIRKLADHNNGIALIFVKAETKLWQQCVWPRSSSILMLDHRISFCNTDGTETGGHFGASCLVAFGKLADTRLRASNFQGCLIEKKRMK